MPSISSSSSLRLISRSSSFVAPAASFPNFCPISFVLSAHHPSSFIRLYSFASSGRSASFSSFFRPFLTVSVSFFTAASKSSFFAVSRLACTALFPSVAFSSTSPTFFAPAPSAASPTLNAASVASCLPMSFAISLRLFPSAIPAAIVIGVFTIVSAACCPSILVAKVPALPSVLPPVSLPTPLSAAFSAAAPAVP